MANIGRTDTVPSMLTPGEVVMNEEQITLLGKILTTQACKSYTL